MGFGGGGGDGGASAREAARQGRVKTLQDDIRKRFFAVDENGNLTENPTAERSAAFDDIEKRTRDFFIPDFNQDTQDAQRELGFALARRGIFGGSGQIDAESRLNDQIRKGEREIGVRVTNARSAAESADQQLLNSLLNEATADPEAEGLLSGIKGSQLVNANQALANAQQGGLENVFSNVGSLFKDIKDNQAFNQSVGSASQFAALLGRSNSPFTNNSSQKNFSGNISG